MATEIAFVVWCGTVSWGRIRAVLKRGVVPFVLAYAVVASIAAALGVDPYRSVWSSFERMIGVWTIWHLTFFFVMLVTVVLSERRWQQIFQAILASGAIVAGTGLIEIISAGGRTRIDAFLHNASFLASYLLVVSFISLWMLLRSEQWTWISGVYAVLCVLSFLVMVFSGTRGAIIGYGVGMVVLATYIVWGIPAGRYVSLGNRQIKKIAVAMLGLPIIIVVLGVLYHDQLAASSIDPVSRLASISISDRTIGGRLLAWRVAWTGWREHFWFGWGPENFHLLFDRYYDPALYEQEPWFDRAHNSILDVGATTGVVGLAAYLSMFIASSVVLVRRKNGNNIPFMTRAVFFALIVAYSVQNAFVFDTLISLILMTVVFAYVTFLAGADTAPRGTFSAFMVSIAACLMVPVFYFSVLTPVLQNYFGKSGYDALADGRDEEAFTSVERALAYHASGDVDVRRAVVEYVFDFLKLGGKRNPEALGRLLEYSIKKSEENIADEPQDVKWRMYQGQLYNLHAALFEDRKLEYAKRAEERYLEAALLSPKRPQIYLEIAQARKVQGNIRGMWEALDRTISLAPEYFVPHLNAVVQAVEVGDRTREQNERMWLEMHDKMDYIALRDVYYKTRRIPEAIAMQQKFIELKSHSQTFPKKELSIHYRNLAVFYSEIGDAKQARAATLRVIELDPSQRESAEAFLRSLGN